MKRFFVLLISFISVSRCGAQSAFALFTGPQITSAKYSVNGIEQSVKHKIGFQIGGEMKIVFDEHLFFSPSAFYSLKGYKASFTQFAYPPDTAAIDNNTVIHTFELAALLQFDFGEHPSHFFVKAGPSLDFQLAGRENFNLKSGASVQRSMDYAFTAYGHYGANLILQVGYETSKGLTLFGQYSLGLANLNNADAGPTIKHRIFGISVGKYFNSKKLLSLSSNK